MFDALNDQIKKALSGRGGSKTFAIHGSGQDRRAAQAGDQRTQGHNPFTREETTFKAKPARNVVKIRPLKKLKDMVS